LAERIQKIVSKVKIEQTKISFQDARNYRVSTDKVNKDLKFVPRYTIENGIQEVANEITQNRIKDVGNPKFNNSESLRLQWKG
jgi:nucleoside-diphosphate-sugar epimerase